MLGGDHFINGCAINKKIQKEWFLLFIVNFISNIALIFSLILKKSIYKKYSGLKPTKIMISKSIQHIIK